MQLINLFIRKFFITVIRLYQITISPIFGPKCRFHPSCSNYALESFRTLPPLRALWYVGLRIIKCQPFCSGGIDPVPKQ